MQRAGKARREVAREGKRVLSGTWVSLRLLPCGSHTVHTVSCLLLMQG